MDFRQIMYIRYSGVVGESVMVLGTAQDLAEEMRAVEFADYEINEVYGLDQLSDLKPLRWEIKGSGFGEGGLGARHVVVHFPDGHRDVVPYIVDGNG